MMSFIYSAQGASVNLTSHSTPGSSQESKYRPSHHLPVESKRLTISDLHQSR